MARRAPILLLLVTFVATGLPAGAAAGTLVPSLTSLLGQEEPAPSLASLVPQERSVEPVVLTGDQFAGWSAGPELSLREPTLTSFQSDCPDEDGRNHNCSQGSRIPDNPREGVPVDRLIAYRWDSLSASFAQIPFQVDERFTRYISNLASNCNDAGGECVGFGAYSGADPQLSYVYDREGYRFTEHVPGDSCQAAMKPGDGPEADPVRGLDDNDELVLLYRDTGEQAPSSAPTPDGIVELRAVRIDDPSRPGSPSRFAYIGLASEDGPERKFNAANGYMRYVRDANADVYEGTSSNYGNAPRGPHCDDEGNVIGNGPRRPRDTAWVLTPRYAFRYEARWVLRGVRVADGHREEPLDSPDDYGPPLIDQWKARAYQQAPGASTPCCGFQTEQDDWGASSVLLGEKAGPVRVIRTTWGSNSGTNTVRQEILYPDLIVQENYLRVHPIPPLGGIFSYWDHTAGVITKYYNPQRPEGVDVDGQNDEVFGNFYVHTGSGGLQIRTDDPLPLLGPQDLTLGSPGDCMPSGFCSDFDLTDPTLNATGLVSWEQVSGEFGAMVFRSGLKEVTPGGAQALAAIPYYRDDSCFDDGTGIDPGPHLMPKRVDVPERPCWKPEDGRPTGDPEQDVRWRQGLIGAHGVQVMVAAETDNLFTTLPATEIQAEERIVILPGDPGNVGEQYSNEIPLVSLVTDASLAGVLAVNPTTIEIAGDTQGRPGRRAKIEATLEDRLGPVAGATLHFNFQGMRYSEVTDDQGKATLGVIVRGPPGSTKVTVSYEGDRFRSPGFAEAGFEVTTPSSSPG